MGRGMEPPRIRPGWLMPSELELERVEARKTMARMMHRHDRYRRKMAVKAFLRRIAGTLSLSARGSRKGCP